VPAVFVGSLLSSTIPDRYVRPAIAFVIFASGLKYVGLGTAALGWTLCAILLLAAAPVDRQRTTLEGATSRGVAPRRRPTQRGGGNERARRDATLAGHAADSRLRAGSFSVLFWPSRLARTEHHGSRC
jgi:hypothetical protein